ncbi:MAG: GNAT family N-acetyltransferase, partial [Fimbriiglobus sp.]
STASETAPTRVRIRAARRTDLADIAAVLAAQDTFHGNERAVANARLTAAVGRRTLGRVLVAHTDDGPAGVAWVRADEWAGTANLELLAVTPAARRAGVGSALLAAAEREATAAGGRALLAHIQSATWFAGIRQFLARHGFTAAGELPDFYPDGYARVTYAKPLPLPAPATRPQSQSAS